MTSKLLLIILSLFLNCNSSAEKVTEKETPEEIQEEPYDDQETYLVGEFERKELEQRPYSYWFNSGYKHFKPLEEPMKRIDENISDYEIVLFMGTWCADSQLEVPKLYKILDQAGYDSSKLTSFALNLDKETPNQIEKEYNVNLVPTIIFYKDGVEVNRFVEFAMETFEEDIADIVSENSYKNPYADF
ncbi:MAG TPA: thioredoxin family protein [Salegentibacter sp.]|nr:thioredoxin family protein [Salegentibacter sp.]